METYRLIADRYRNARARSVVMAALSYTVGMAVVYFNTPGDIMVDWVFPVTAAVIALVVVSGLLQRLRSQRRIIETYILKLDADGISREQYGSRPVFISYTGIIAVIQFSGGLIVKSIDPGASVIIPLTLESYEEVSAKLQAIMPFSKQRKKWLKQAVPFVILLVILALFRVFTQSVNNLGTVAGLALLPLLIWSLFYIRKNNRHSIVTFLVLLLLTLLISISLIARLTGIVLF